MRKNRRLLIVLLLLLAVAVGVTWPLVQSRLGFLFEQKVQDAEAIAQLAQADLSQTEQRTSTQNDWPQYLGPTRDGFTPAKNFRTNWNEKLPDVVWSRECGGGYSSFAAVGERVYTQDYLNGQERVLCLNAQTGDSVWTYAAERDYSVMKAGYAQGPRATPTIHEGRIYTVGATGMLTCLLEPAAVGQPPGVSWEVDLIRQFKAKLPEWGVACSPLIVRDLVIVQPGGKEGSVVALDRLTGVKRWSTGTESSGYSSPVLATLGGVEQIIAVTGSTILGIRADDGELLWRVPWRTQYEGNVASPVVAGEYVFVSSAYHKGCTLLKVYSSGDRRADVRVVYNLPNELMRNHHSTSVHKDGFLYGYDEQTLRCVNLREQTVVEDWEDPEHRDVLQRKGTVILVGEHLLGLSQSGTLFLARANPTRFELIGKIAKVLEGSECWALPVVRQGLIYVRDHGRIVCLDARLVPLP